MNSFLKSIVATVAAVIVCATASAQDAYYYEGEGFYIKANTRSDIRIGVTGDTKLASAKKNPMKIEVLFFDASQAHLEGYSAKKKDVADADFIINDAHTEMIVEDKGEGKEMMKAFHWANGDIKIEFTIADSQSPSGCKSVTFLLPNEQRKAMVKAVRR